jgi:acetyltransferase-like isoleucine patch superfamily enzyme
MLSDADRAERDAARQAFQDYLNGDCDKPFIIMQHKSYCLEDVLYPSLLSRLRFIRRCLLVWLGGIMPVCPAKAFFYHLAGVQIGRNVCFSPGVVIDPIFPSLIHLDDDCCLGMGCRLLTHEYTATYFRVGPIRVGRGSVVGTYSTVRNGVTIGAKVTIGASSFVNKDVPDGATVGGVPAKPLKVKSGDGIPQ